MDLDWRSGADGIDAFNRLAAQCHGFEPTCPAGRLGLVLDGIVQSAPAIQQPAFEADEIVISGQFTEQEAKDLALVLRYGSLPARVLDIEVLDPREP